MSDRKSKWKPLAQCAVLVLLGYAAYSATHHSAQLACDAAKLKLETSSARGYGSLTAAKREKLEAVNRLCTPADRSLGKAGRIITTWLAT